ncbi:sister chromatid cohesion protein solo [Drosophila miranda]|uniref:sister chromatid cohesion protein solo n=1 Tax=Drosophila miranda TaxID=7229 RepID=UPI00143F9F1B|nr:sister chromatid cohesion protein solo [Drosophila miranda]
MKIPSSWDRDVLIYFLDNLDLRAYTTMPKVRELRDYLFTAFKALVTSEWNALQRHDREEKEKQIQEMAVRSHRIIEEIEQMLNETESGRRQNENMFRQLQEMHMKNRADLGELNDFDHTVVARYRQSRAMQMRGRGRRRRRTASPPSEEAEQIRHFIDLYRNGRNLNRENQGAVLPYESSSEDEAAALPSTFDATRFAHWFSDNYMQEHRMVMALNFGSIRQLKDRMPQPPRELRRPWAWQEYELPDVVSDVGANRAVQQMEQRVLQELREQELQELQEQELQADGDGGGYSSTQASGLQINVAREQQSQKQDTPDGAYFSRNVSTHDDDTGGPRVAATSTPLTNSIHDGLTFIPRSSSLLLDEDRTPLMMPGSEGALSLPPEFSLEAEFPMPSQMVDSGKGQSMEVDDSGSTMVRSRLGATPFRPFLPVIDEEQQVQQRNLTMLPRVLEMSLDSPLAAVERAAEGTPEAVAEGTVEALPEGAPGAVAVASPTSPREWSAVFRARGQITRNYYETPPPRPPKRARRAIPASVDIERRADPASEDIGHRADPASEDIGHRADPASEDIRHQENPEHIQGELPRVNTEITMSFMATLLQEATDVVAHSLKMITVPEVQEQPQQVAPPLPPDEALVDPSVLPEILNESLPNISVSAVPNIEIMDPLPVVQVLQPTIPSLADLSEHAVVTDVQILPPLNLDRAKEQSRGSSVCPAIDQTGGSEDRSEEITFVQASSLQQNVATEDSLQLVENVAFLLKHKDKIRLMFDHQKHLSDQHQYPAEESSSSGTETNNRCFPAVQTYDSDIILNMPRSKLQLVHGLLEALITLPQVDLQNASFIRNRLDAANAFRYVLDLKTAGIVTLCDDGRFFSLN